MPILLLIFVVLIFISSAICLYYLIKSPTENKQPAPDQTLIHSAMKKAQSILGMAEIESIKLVSDTKTETIKLEHAYQAQLEAVTLQAQKQLNEAVSLSVNEFNAYLNALKSRSEQMDEQTQELAKQNFTKLFAKFEENLTNFLNRTEQRSAESVEAEIKAARQLIENYKVQQLAIIDENIITMLERTLSLVIPKKLSLNDQMELIYEALERAKAEKFIV
jgi:hypothetical protein